MSKPTNRSELRDAPPRNVDRILTDVYGTRAPAGAKFNRGFQKAERAPPPRVAGTPSPATTVNVTRNDDLRPALPFGRECIGMLRGFLSVPRGVQIDTVIDPSGVDHSGLKCSDGSRPLNGVGLRRRTGRETGLPRRLIAEVMHRGKVRIGGRDLMDFISAAFFLSNQQEQNSNEQKCRTSQTTGTGHGNS